MNKGAARWANIIVTLRLQNGEEIPVILDTGSSVSVFDESLSSRFGRRTETRQVWIPNGFIEIPFHETPNLLLEGTPLKLRRVGLLNTNRFRISPPAKGILGMDCLSNYCIQLDFEAAAIRFLRPEQIRPNELGNLIPLKFAPTTTIVGKSIDGAENSNMLIDTGCDVDVQLPIERGDDESWALKSVSEWNLFGSAYTNVLIRTRGGRRLLGLPFLARHLVTLDFPQHRLFLKQTHIGPFSSVTIEQASAFIASVQDQLPGWGHENTQLAYADPESPQTIALRKLTDNSIYHYSFTNAWADLKIVRAWRSDNFNHLQDELNVKNLPSLYLPLQDVKAEAIARVATGAPVLKHDDTLPKGVYEFPLNANAGRWSALIVKVRFEDGEEVPVAIATSVWTSSFDESLRKKFSRKLGKVRQFNDDTGPSIDTYASPDLTLGDLHLNLERVGIMDIQSLYGFAAKGVLGVDFLRRFTVQLDFQNQKLILYEAGYKLSDDLGKKFLFVIGDARPRIESPLLGGNANTTLLLDTAWDNDGTFAKDAGFLAASKDTPATLSQCTWNGWTYRNLIGEPPSKQFKPSIGLNFLARHLVTIDFPKSRLWLKQVTVEPLELESLRSATSYINRLANDGKLPGWGNSKSGDFFADPDFIHTVAGRQEDSTDTYHYTLKKVEDHWVLSKSWKSDPAGHIQEINEKR